MALRLNVGNLSNVSEEYPVVPEGVYSVQVGEMKMEKSSKDKDMLTVKLSVVDNAEYMGHTLWDRISLSDRALWRLRQFCEAIGLPWDDAGVDVEPAQGRVVLVKVVQELYQPEGKEPRRSNKIAEYVKQA